MPPTRRPTTQGESVDHQHRAIHSLSHGALSDPSPSLPPSLPLRVSASLYQVGESASGFDGPESPQGRADFLLEKVHHIDSLIASIPAAMGTEEEKVARLLILEGERSTLLTAMEGELGAAEALLAVIRSSLITIASDSIEQP